MESAQDLVFWQGGEEETKSLHQPHALAALHTHTHIIRDSGCIHVDPHLIILIAVCSPYGPLSPVRPAEGSEGELIPVVTLMVK